MLIFVALMLWPLELCQCAIALGYRHSKNSCTAILHSSDRNSEEVLQQQLLSRPGFAQCCFAAEVAHLSYYLIIQAWQRSLLRFKWQVADILGKAKLPVDGMLIAVMHLAHVDNDRTFIHCCKNLHRISKMMLCQSFLF